MKILLSVDASDYTKRMLAYLAAHTDRWIRTSVRDDVVPNTRNRQPRQTIRKARDQNLVAGSTSGHRGPLGRSDDGLPRTG